MKIEQGNKEWQKLWQDLDKSILLHKEAFCLLHNLPNTEAREVALEALRTSARKCGDKRYALIINKMRV